MRVVANVVANWAAFVIGTAITLVLSPFVVHHLGDARYGVWSVVGSFVGYLGLLDLGIRVAVTRFVAHHEARRELPALNRVVTSALAIFGVAGVVAVLLGGVGSVLLPGVTDLPAAHLADARLALALSGVTVAAALLGGVYGGVIAGVQRLTLLNAIDLGTEIVRAGAVYLALSSGGGLVDLALIQLGVVAVRGLAYRRTGRRLLPGLRAARDLLDNATVRQLLRFSSYTMILHVCYVVIQSSDSVIVAAIMPLAMVTPFAIAASLILASVRVLGGVSQALAPLVTARQATQGTGAGAALLTRSMRMGGLVFLPIIITFFVRGGTFIGLWMGADYAVPSGQVLRILSVGIAFFASYQVLTVTIMALNLHRAMVPAFIAEAAANVVLSVSLGMAFGLAGVAWGITLPRLAVAAGYGPWFARRTLGVSPADYAISAWGRPFAALLPFALATLALDRLWPATGVTLFFCQTALLLPVAAAGAWLLALTPDERETIRSRLLSAAGQHLDRAERVA